MSQKDFIAKWLNRSSNNCFQGKLWTIFYLFF